MLIILGRIVLWIAVIFANLTTLVCCAMIDEMLEKNPDHWDITGRDIMQFMKKRFFSFWSKKKK